MGRALDSMFSLLSSSTAILRKIFVEDCDHNFNPVILGLIGLFQVTTGIPVVMDARWCHMLP